MSQQGVNILSLSFIPTAIIGANLFVSPTGGLAAAAGNSIGVTRYLTAVGVPAIVDTSGTAVVVAGAAIAAGAAVEIDAAGRAVTKAAGVAVGRMAPGQVAAALGDLVEVILIPN